MPVTAVRRKYDYIARLYDILELPIEYGRHRAIRRRIFEGLSGTVLDAGAGTGRNMPFYPADARVVGIDFSPAMLGRARRRRERLGVEAELLEMDVLRTTFPDRHFDAIVATFLFCVLDEAQQLPALKELARICKPAGSIHILDYAYPEEGRSRSAILRLWAPYVRWVFGAAFDRDTERYLPAAGLEMVERRLLSRGIIRLIIARPLSRAGTQAVSPRQHYAGDGPAAPGGTQAVSPRLRYAGDAPAAPGGTQAVSPRLRYAGDGPAAPGP